jgi:hypothetical protein
MKTSAFRFQIDGFMEAFMFFEQYMKQDRGRKGGRGRKTMDVYISN